MTGGDGLHVTDRRGIVTPTSPAVQCFYYASPAPTPPLYEQSAGVYRDFLGARTVALAFPFETVDNFADRLELLRRSLCFLGIRTAPSLNGIKAYPDGEWAAATGKIVTAVFDGFFYIEDPDRTSGIRVVSAEMAAVGSKLNVEGPLGTIGQERCINAGRIEDLGYVGLLEPLGVSNRSLGGASIPGQTGVMGASGANNIGLLIRTWGRVIEVTADGFTIDDGSGASVEVLAGNLGLPAAGSYVSVAGISSCVERGEQAASLVLLTEPASTY